MRAHAGRSSQNRRQSSEIVDGRLSRTREISRPGDGVGNDDPDVHIMTDTSRNDDYTVGRYQIALSNQQSRHPVDESRLAGAATAVLQDSEFSSAAISLAIVDDETIHELNRRHLDHDWPTDVLSFV